MTRPSSRLSLLRKIAVACAVLVLAITSLSAFLRQSRAGLGCEPWPQCYRERAVMSAEQAARFDTTAVGMARLAHRGTAVAALLLVIVMMMQSLAQQPMLWPQGRLALALLALALFLAVLGRLGADSRQPLVTLGNLLAGFAMFALGCRLVQASGPPADRAKLQRWRTWVLASLVLLSAQVALGALVSASHVADRCGDSALCALHRGSGIVTAAVLLPLGLLAWRGGQRRGATIVALVLLQPVLGWLVATSAAPLVPALAHNLTAALLLATVLTLLPPR